MRSRRYLAAARRRFNQPAEAFPSPAHRWGVQNAYVQSLADLGILGLVAFLAALLVPRRLAARRGFGDARVLGIALPLLDARRVERLRPRRGHPTRSARPG